MTIMKNNARQRTAHYFATRLAVAAGILALMSACGGAANKQAETIVKAPNAANESAAIRSLQTIFRAETQHMTLSSGSYGTLDDLVKDGSLDQRFAGQAPVVEGYVFTLRLQPDSAGQPTAYTVNADPKDAAAPGARHLFMDATSNVVRANAGQPATVNDPPIQ